MADKPVPKQTGLFSEIEQQANMISAAEPEPTSAASQATMVPDRLWIGGGAHPYSGTNAAPGAGGATAKLTATPSDVLRQVYGLAGDPSRRGEYLAYAQRLVDIGALYDMRYATNVSSVIDATNKAMVMYSNSGVDMGFSPWLSSSLAMPVDDGSGSGGGGGGGAAAQQPADPSSIRRAMDQVSTGLLGLTLSDKEFDKYYGTYTSDFSGNPDMDPTQHMIEAARTDDNYEEFQVATKFTGALSDVLKGFA